MRNALDFGRTGRQLTRSLFWSSSMRATCATAHAFDASWTDYGDNGVKTIEYSARISRSRTNDAVLQHYDTLHFRPRTEIAYKSFLRFARCFNRYLNDLDYVKRLRNGREIRGYPHECTAKDSAKKCYTILGGNTFRDCWDCLETRKRRRPFVQGKTLGNF